MSAAIPTASTRVTAAVVHVSQKHGPHVTLTPPGPCAMHVTAVAFPAQKSLPCAITHAQLGSLAHVDVNGPQLVMHPPHAPPSGGTQGTCWQSSPSCESGPASGAPLLLLDACEPPVPVVDPLTCVATLPPQATPTAMNEVAIPNRAKRRRLIATCLG
jgi:hypothetical protein